MALTYTPPAELGSPLPQFQLPGVDGQTYQPQSFSSAKAIVVMFICNHCPYVKAVEDRLIETAREYLPRGVQFVAICSNDPEEYPEDSFSELKKRAESKKYPFPYLHDLKQTVARSFGAVCTPDFFAYDENRHLAYRGRLDDSWKDPAKVVRRELALAIDSILQNSAVTTEQIPSMGCSIKWREN